MTAIASTLPSLWSPTPRPGDAGARSESPQAAQASAATTPAGKDASGAEAKERATPASATTNPNGESLTEAELTELQRLKATDQEVRRHEMAHQSNGGEHTGGVSYEYQRGPDGQRYAVAGEVSVDHGPVPGDPRATIDKMEQVRAAALAPAEPSAQDRKVAAQASQYLMAARLELAQQQSEMDSAREGATAASGQNGSSEEEMNGPTADTSAA